MMSLSKTYQTNPDKEINGVVVTLGEKNEDGTQPAVTLARTGRMNKRYTKSLERSMKPYQSQIRLKTLASEKIDSLLMESFIEGALLKWEYIPLSDVTGNSGDKGYAEFTKENATKLFVRLPDLYDDLTTQANDSSLFKEGLAEAVSGN